MRYTRFEDMLDLLHQPSPFENLSRLSNSNLELLEERFEEIEGGAREEKPLSQLHIYLIILPLLPIPSPQTQLLQYVSGQVQALTATKR